MTAWEFALWWREYRVNPWGERRADAYSAAQMQTIANYAGKMRKDPAPIESFILDFDPDKQPEPEPDPAAFFNQFMK